MGKAKNDSDDDMAMDIEQPQPVKKKNKLIAKKNRSDAPKQSFSEPAKFKNNVVRELAKSVNLKSRHKSLEQKQEIFQKIVKGLQQKTDLSKKDKKKSRVLLKREMRKHLEEERIHLRKKSADLDQKTKTENIQLKNPEKHKKAPVDQRAQSNSFHQLMGAGLSNIRDMIAKNTLSNKKR